MAKVNIYMSLNNLNASVVTFLLGLPSTVNRIFIIPFLCTQTYSKPWNSSWSPVSHFRVEAAVVLVRSCYFFQGIQLPSGRPKVRTQACRLWPSLPCPPTHTCSHRQGAVLRDRTMKQCSRHCSPKTQVPPLAPVPSSEQLKGFGQWLIFPLNWEWVVYSLCWI